MEYLKSSTYWWCIRCKNVAHQDDWMKGTERRLGVCPKCGAYGSKSAYPYAGKPPGPKPIQEELFPDEERRKVIGKMFTRPWKR